MYLLLERELKSKRFGYFFARLPSLDALDQLNSHCLTTGFIFLTAGDRYRLDLGAAGLGHLLAVGPEGDLVADHLVHLSGADPSAVHCRLAGQAGSSNGDARFCLPWFLPSGVSIIFSEGA